MITRKYLLISCVFMIFIVYLYSQSLVSDLSLKFYNKLGYNVIQNEIEYENEIELSECYRVIDRSICENFNGVYLNKSEITIDQLQLLENDIQNVSYGSVFLDYRFFDNTVQTSVEESCIKELELIYCEQSLRYYPQWACNFELANKSQYLGDLRIYYQDISIFKDHVPIPMDIQDRLFLKYIQNLKIFDSLNGDIDFNIYNEKYIFPPEPSMIKVAYTLLINSQSANDIDLILLRYQLRALSIRNGTIIVIHIDQNIDRKSFELINAEVEEFTSRGHNIFILPYRYKYIPGTSSKMYIQLSCFAYLFQLEQDNPNLAWDFVINLSEYDFPIKPFHHIQQHLHDNRITHMEHYRATSHDLSQRYHPRRIQVKCENTLVSTELALEKILKDVEFPVGRPFNTTKPYLEDYFKGSEWFIMAKQHALYILKNIDIDLILAVKHTFSPHETVFHTILANSEYSKSLSKNIFRITGLSAGPVTASNQNLYMKHFEMLKVSRALLARKVVDTELAENILRLVNS